MLAEKCYEKMAFEESTTPTKLKTIDILIHYLIIAAEMAYQTPQSGKQKEKQVYIKVQ